MQGSLIARPRALARLRQALAANPVCALLGPRQCGKTTLAREIAGRRRGVHFFDLETAVARRQLAEP